MQIHKCAYGRVILVQKGADMWNSGVGCFVLFRFSESQQTYNATY